MRGEQKDDGVKDCEERIETKGRKRDEKRGKMR
jgi:hypothetical protein